MRATLTFGCGARDESFMTIGVTHLIEHLAMSTLPRLHHEHNASVDLESTNFYATGRPEQIVTFLRRVCEALANLPLDRRATEASVLAAEGGHTAHPTAACLLARRYGIRGLGLAPWAGPGFDTITPEAVRAHVARYFVAGNAVLQLTGPPPADLRLPLPAGPRADHDMPPARQQDGPLWSAESASPGVGLSLLAGRHIGWPVGMAVLAERVMQRARHEHGLSYEVGLSSALVDRAKVERAVIADARRGHEAAVAAILWEEARRLADQGPTAEELGHEREAIREMHADPRAVEAELGHAAEAELFGFDAVTPADRLAAVEALTSTDVAGFFAAALPTALLVVPEDVQPALPGVAEGGCPRGRTVLAGPVFRSTGRGGPQGPGERGSYLVLEADGVAYVQPDGDVHHVRFDDIVGMEVDGDGRLVFGSHGCIILVDRSLYRGADTVVRAIDAAVPAHLRYVDSAASSRVEGVGGSGLAHPNGTVATYALVTKAPAASILAAARTGRVGGYVVTDPLGTIVLFDPPSRAATHRRLTKPARELMRRAGVTGWLLLGDEHVSEAAVLTPKARPLWLQWAADWTPPEDPAAYLADRKAWDAFCARVAARYDAPDRAAELALVRNDPVPGRDQPPVADLLRQVCAVFDLPDVAVGRSLLDTRGPGLPGAQRFDPPPRGALRRLFARS
jgi:hypothetical protein